MNYFLNYHTVIMDRSTGNKGSFYGKNDEIYEGLILLAGILEMMLYTTLHKENTNKKNQSIFK